MNEKTIKYFSMFTGVGGFELGLQNAGLIQQEGSGHKSMSDRTTSQHYSCVGFSEIDKYASELLANKFPDIKNYGDATKIKPSELPDFDMLCGGFPCQAFSIAGKRRGFQDTRGTLFFEISRILKVKRPKIVFLENVKGLLNHEKGKTFRKIIQTLSELGYVIQWMVLNSKFFGVPQNRERVFIIGSLRGEPIPEILPFGGNYNEIDEERIVHGTITEAIGRQGSSKEYMRSIEVIGNLNNETWSKRHENIRRVYGTGGISPTIPTGTGGGVMTKIAVRVQGDLDKRKTYLSEEVGTLSANPTSDNLPRVAIPVLTPDRPEKRQNGRRFKEDGEPSFTLTGQDIHGVSDGMRIRRLTPTEGERLQGFPSGWTEGFSDTQRYKMMGNAVTVNVIKAIGERLI